MHDSHESSLWQPPTTVNSVRNLTRPRAVFYCLDTVLLGRVGDCLLDRCFTSDITSLLAFSTLMLASLVGAQITLGQDFQASSTLLLADIASPSLLDNGTSAGVCSCYLIIIIIMSETYLGIS